MYWWNPETSNIAAPLNLYFDHLVLIFWTWISFYSLDRLNILSSAHPIFSISRLCVVLSIEHKPLDSSIPLYLRRPDSGE